MQALLALLAIISKIESWSTLPGYILPYSGVAGIQNDVRAGVLTVPIYLI
jgi:hypothetical protein